MKRLDNVIEFFKNMNKEYLKEWESVYEYHLTMEESEHFNKKQVESIKKRAKRNLEIIKSISSL